MPSAPTHTNHLAGSTSPYLLQHVHNPVDWYPWGEDALRRSREEQKPIFLSIGYAACHWCHVMERESFESEDVAAILNREFIAIKVDREERPDLDEIYMAATQLMTHSGGWPMSVFLTPELKPFYAGTYFPPEDRWGRPGFKTLLNEIARAWRERRPTLEEQAERITDAVAQFTSGGEGQGAVSASLVQGAVEKMAQGFDPKHGGFGSAPKFPPSMRVELFLRRHASEGDARLLRMAELTLDRMARGGMYDQVGGGFHRYSVDERWLVPHFEKMLYDNALLSRVYPLAYEQTGNWYYGRVAREIFDYVLREMTHPDGGIYSTTDADSEGEEGKFFVWSRAEVVEVLGKEDGDLFSRIYDVTPRGNFEGHNIPNLISKGLDEWASELHTDGPGLDARLAPMRRALWESREKRVHPLLDDKILSGWNGLMIRALAEGYRVFHDDRYREAAERAADFVLTRMRDGDRLLRSFREGKAHLNAYQEDYAFMAAGLLDLHLATDAPRWRDEGLALIDVMDARCWDETSGSYFFTTHDHEQLIARARSLQDGATPSGNSMAAIALVRAARITGEERFRDRAARLLGLAAPQIDQMPAGFPNMVVAADEYLTHWPGGVTFPAADAVHVEAFLSRTSVQPGERFWVAVRLRIEEGFHLNSSRPLQDYLLPTRIGFTGAAGLRLLRESYPRPQDYEAPFQEEVMAVYSGTVLLGAEIEVEPDTVPGIKPLEVTVHAQPCDDRQCHPPLEIRIRLGIEVSTQPGIEQHSDLFNVLRSQAG